MPSGSGGKDQVPGSTDVDISSSEEEPEIIVKVDPLRASAMGLDSTSVGKVVEMAFFRQKHKQ